MVEKHEISVMSAKIDHIRKNAKLIIVTAIAAVVLLGIWASCCHGIGPLGIQIMKEIDQKSSSDGICFININDLVDFRWDLLIAVSGFYTKSALNRELGIDYVEIDAGGFYDELIFCYDGKVVYREFYKTPIEHPEKLYFSFGVNQPQYHVVSPDNDVIYAKRFLYPATKSEWHYILLFNYDVLS